MSRWPSAFAQASVALFAGLFAANIAGARLNGVLVCVFAALSAVIAFRLRPAAPSAVGPRSGARSTLEYAGLAVLALALVCALLQATALPMYHWDALVLYGFKAKVLFHEGTFRTPAFLDRGVAHPNADYPLLVPYLEAAAYFLLGDVDERRVRLLFWLFWAAYLGLVYGALRRRVSRPASLALTALLASCPLFSADDATQAVSGTVDVAFALYWTGAIVAAIEHLERPDPRRLAGALLLLLGAVCAKPHGAALLPAFAVVVGWRLRPRSFVALFLAAAAVWFWVRAGLTHNVDYSPRALDLASLRVACERAPVVAAAWLRELLPWRSWGLFWPVCAVAVAAAARARAPSTRVRLVLAVLALQVLTYSAVYLIVPNEIHSFLAVTLTRLMVHSSGLAVIAAGWSLAESGLLR